MVVVVVTPVERQGSLHDLVLRYTAETGADSLAMSKLSSTFERSGKRRLILIPLDFTDRPWVMH